MSNRSLVFSGLLIFGAWVIVGAGCDSSLPPAKSDGAAKDGNTTQQDGNTTKTDGNTTKTDGNTTQPDGNTTKTDGNTTQTDGNTTKPDGNTTKPDGSITRPDGNTTKPDGPTTLCGTEGQTIRLGGRCCAGLTPGSIGIPPSCITIGQTFICVRCGDGKCDATKGENECSCPRDCKTPTTDCVSKGGYCERQFTKCKVGYAISKLSCGGALSLTCCMPTKCVGVTCPAPTCQMTKAGDCIATSSQCDSTSGLCTRSSKTTSPSCSMSGTSCVQSTPSCSGTSCASTARVMARTCKQSGNDCIQSTPGCASNQCSARTATITNATCNTLTGSCLAVAGCKTACDCNQGLMCTSGKCIAGVKPVYCCSKPGCPTGQACVNPNGTSGKCPAVTTECEKLKGICVTQFTVCPKGYSLSSGTSCGSVRSLQCCLPRITP